MNPTYSLRLLQYGQMQPPYTLRAGMGHEGKPLTLQAQSGMRFQLTETKTLQAPAKLHIERQGQDLLITLPEGNPAAPDLVITGYFDAQDVAVMGRNSAGDWQIYDNTERLWLAQDKGITPASLSQGQATTAALSSSAGESWFDGEKGWVMVGVGTAALVAGVASLNHDPNTSTDTASGLDAIKAYANSSTSAQAPSLRDYQKAGVDGVEPNTLEAINSAIAASPLDLSVGANVQKVVDAYRTILGEANGASADATPDSDPTVTDYHQLGVLLGAQQDNPNALALLNDAVGQLNADACDTVAELKAIVTVVQKLMNIASGLAPASALTTADLLLLGLSQAQLDETHAADNLSAIVSAIGATADNGSDIASVAQLHALMSAYDKVLTEANGSTVADVDVLSNPTAADFAALDANIGKAAKSTTALTMLNQVIGELQRADVDSINEINALAATLDTVSSRAAQTADNSTDVTFSATALSKLGLTGFASTGANNQAVADLLSDTVRDLRPMDVDTLPELQALVSMEVLRVWARDAAPTKSAAIPSADDYIDMGVVRSDASANTVVVSASDATALNSFADKLADAQLDSLSEVKQLAGSLFKLLNEANGSEADNNTTTNPLATDYAILGVNGHAGHSTDALNSAAARLLTDVVATKTNTQVDTPTELNTLSASVDHVLDVAAGTAPTSTLGLTDFSTLGVTGASTGNLTTVANRLQATADDGSGADTLAELQALVSLARIQRYADDTNVNSGGSNEGGLPSLADYAAAGAALGSVATVPASNLLILVNEAVAAKTGAAVDTTTEVQAIQAAATKVMQLAAIDKTSGASDADSAAVGGFTVSDLSQLGLDVSLLTSTSFSSTVLSHRLTDVRNRIVYSDNTGLSVEHLSQLQTFINATAVIVT